MIWGVFGSIGLATATFLAGAGIAFGWSNRTHKWAQKNGSPIPTGRGWNLGFATGGFTVVAVVGWIMLLQSLLS